MLTRHAIIFITHREKLRHRELKLSEGTLLEEWLRVKAPALSMQEKLSELTVPDSQVREEENWN